eukprot:122642-Amphidinium_carterae.1
MGPCGGSEPRRVAGAALCSSLRCPIGYAEAKRNIQQRHHSVAGSKVIALVVEELLKKESAVRSS